MVMDIYGKRIDAHTVRFERLLPGPVEKIWAYLTDGQKRGEWFASGALPAKVGETFELNFKHSDLSPNKAPPPERFKEMDAKGFRAKERLLALEPMRRIVHTFGEDNPPPSEVEFLLTFLTGWPATENKVFQNARQRFLANPPFFQLRITLVVKEPTVILRDIACLVSSGLIAVYQMEK